MIGRIRLEYFNGNSWTPAGNFTQEDFAWISLGGDDYNYRTVDAINDKVLTDKSEGGGDEDGN